jgi:hypothetical protein
MDDLARSGSQHPFLHPGSAFLIIFHTAYSGIIDQNIEVTGILPNFFKHPQDVFTIGNIRRNGVTLHRFRSTLGSFQVEVIDYDRGALLVKSPGYCFT